MHIYNAGYSRVDALVVLYILYSVVQLHVLYQ